MPWTVAVVGGGNAGLCAAMAARDAGARVLLFERAPEHLRGGNSRHTRNIRTAHDGADSFMSGGYPPDELREDLRTLNADPVDPAMTDLLVEESLSVATWMEDHGARWQAPLRGTLHLSRTNRFFLGGGKYLVNAYYQHAESRGIEIRYRARVRALVMRADRCVGLEVDAADGSTSVIACDAVVLAAGGFEANLDWLGESWGDAAQNFIVRGTPYNDGAVLRLVLGLGATAIGDPTRFHAVAVDARSPKFDGGIVTRLDTVPVGIVVNKHARRFYDEGEDIWPKRYAQWGGLIAGQDGQIAYSVTDAQRRHAIMPPVYRPFESDTVEGLAEQIDLDPTALAETIATYNAHIEVGQASDLSHLDGCRTVGLTPPKSNWALPIDEPPFIAFPLRPGITFTYHGLSVDLDARVRRSSASFENIFAAGEIMAGNVLTQGYIAGIGMTIGTVFGRIAGRSAAAHA